MERPRKKKRLPQGHKVHEWQGPTRHLTVPRFLPLCLLVSKPTVWSHGAGVAAPGPREIHQATGCEYGILSGRTGPCHLSGTQKLTRYYRRFMSLCKKQGQRKTGQKTHDVAGPLGVLGSGTRSTRKSFPLSGPQFSHLELGCVSLEEMLWVQPTVMSELKLTLWEL